MLTNKANIGQVAGMDTRSIASANTFTKLQNISFRPDLACIDTAWGWEPLRPWQYARVYTAAEFNDVISVYPWNTSSGRIEYILQEGVASNNGRTSNCLFHEYANGTRVILDEGRAAPSYSEAGTQYIPYGRFVIALNGENRMLKFWGDNLVTPFGFTTQPPAPQLVGVDPTRLVPDSSSALAADNNGELTNNGLGIAMYPHLKLLEEEWIVDPLIEYELPSGNTLAVTAASGIPKDKTYWGLGTTGELDRNTYSYKVAWVSDTGSESPSSESVTVSWVIPARHDGQDAIKGRPKGDNFENINPYGIKYGVMISSVPTGPDNIVARRIYRTKNKAEGLTGAGDEYFLVKEIRDNLTSTYIDFIPDSQLVTREPGVSGSYIIPGTVKYGTTWDSRLWLAGGNGNETTVQWSAQGRPEQFGAFDFFDCGVREGGSITAVHAVDKGLYIFREHSIDVVIKGGDGGYKIGTISAGIGTVATNTVQTIPGIGTMFLSYDGVYLIDTQGAISKVSHQIQTVFDRATLSALPRASAVYSKKYQEYYIIFPSGGSVISNQGAVYHVGLNGWSVRGTFSDENRDYSDYWKWNALAVDSYGDILIAPSVVSVSVSGGHDYGNVGVQVVSRCNEMGTYLPHANATTVEGGTTFSSPEYKDVTSIIQSGWARYADHKNSTVSSILTIYPTAISEESFYWLADGRLKKSRELVSNAVFFNPDEYNSTTADAVWNSSTSPVDFPTTAVYDESYVSNHRLTKVRFDMQLYARDSVAWSFESQTRLMLHSWELVFVGNTVQTQRAK